MNRGLNIANEVCLPLYVLGVAILLYSIFMSMRKEPFSRRVALNIRRIYYSVYFIGAVIIFDVSSEATIKAFGKNKLGISEEIWFFLMAMLAGFILDILVVSAMSLKEVAFGSAKIQVAGDDIAQHVKSQVDLTNDLTKKIISHYNMTQNLGKYIEPLVSRIKKGTVDIFKEYQEFLGAYFAYQREHDVDEENGLKVDVIEVDEVMNKKEYKITEKEHKKMLEQIESNQSFFIQKGKNQYMFIPYRSVILDYNTILIVMNSRKTMVKVEQYIIISLLQQLEERLIYQFYQHTKVARKNGGKYYKKMESDK